LTVRPYWLWPPPARVFHARVSRSIGCRCDASFERQFSGVVRGHRRALRRTGPRPPTRRSELRTVRRHCGSSWLRRSGRARPSSSNPRCCTPRRSMVVDGRPDASLEVSCPLQRSPATSLLCAGRRHLSGDPASTVDLRRRPPSPLASRSRGRCIVRCSDTRRATPCTHAPATLAVLAVLRLAELARSTLRGSTPRVLAGTLRRSRRVAASHASEPAASHAPAHSWSAGVPLPAGRVTWPGRAPFRRSKLAWVSVP